MSRVTVLSCATLLAIGTLAPRPLLAYGGDTHYYLRFASALETCFDWDEAHLIASADYMLDKNRATTAEKQPVQSRNKVNWHAFGHSEERFNELWERVEQETDPELQLVKLGQFLHFISDWESHYGYGIRMGHGLPTIFGRDPDSLANSAANNFRMIGQTLDHMVRVCVMQGRVASLGDDPDRRLAEIGEELQSEPLLRELHDFNSRRWKLFGYRGKKSKAILAKNHRLIEELIERRGLDRPERGVPADFTPGDPERGLPPPIGLRYDSDGNVVAVYGPELELSPEYDGTEMSAALEERFEEQVETDLVDDLEEEVQEGRDLDLFSNVELEVRDVDLVPGGWRIEAVVENMGSGPSEGGTLDVFVVHVASEEVLGQISESVPPLAGGDTVRLSLVVPSPEEPVKEVLVGASLQVFDLSAEGNDIWFAPWKDALRGEFGKKKRSEPREPGAASLLGRPKLWLDSEGDMWAAVHVLVAGGDSSRRLGDVEVAVLSPDGKRPYEALHEDVIWTSAADHKRQVVPARAFLTPPSSDELCRALAGLKTTSDLRLELTIAGESALPLTEAYPLEATLVENIRTACDS